jgi:hypothetical protein
MTPAQLKALKEYQDAVDAYTSGEQQQYDSQGNLVTEDLGSSAMEGIESDPDVKKHELAALRELEEQSREGFTARDRADLARVENQTNRANKGRIGAIQQNMQARGMGGSGMDLVAQMQSSQDANEVAAMRALEQEGMMMDRKSDATQRLGMMFGNMQARDFSQAAAKAQAADEIARFNAANRNDANRFNIGNRQDVSNRNVAGANQFAETSMNAKLGGAQMGYNAATEEENRRLLEEQERKRRKAAQQQAVGQMIGGVAGGVGGAVFGGPAGAAMGASAGSSLGGSAANAYGSDKRLKKDVAPEHDANIEAFLATIQPKSYTYKDDDKPKHGVIAQDLAKSKIGADMLESDENGMAHVKIPDAISALLQAVAHLNKKVGGR